MLYGQLFHEALNNLSEHAGPLGQRLHHLPGLIEVQHYQGSGVLELLWLHNKLQQVCFFRILDEPDIHPC